MFFFLQFYFHKKASGNFLFEFNSLNSFNVLEISSIDSFAKFNSFINGPEICIIVSSNVASLNIFGYFYFVFFFPSALRAFIVSRYACSIGDSVLFCHLRYSSVAFCISSSCDTLPAPSNNGSPVVDKIASN